MKKYIALILVFILGSVILVGCNAKENKESADEKAAKSESIAVVESEKGKDDKNPVATIEMENGKSIKVELYPEMAPNTVRNFISLSNSGFYNGLTFHRVIKGFMIQGGDPEGNGQGGPGYSIKGEFPENEFNQNTLIHERGVISMARTQEPDSAGSQFFIVHEDSNYLDGKYAAFGKVIEGMEVVDEIANSETNSQDKPEKEIKIKKISVDTFGVKYQETEKIEKQS